LNLEPRVEGLIITAVDPESPFRDKLVPNIVIMEVNRQPVNDVASARQLVTPGRNFLLVYYRGAARYVVINEP
jgi:serine protease Do/serine protease DegQ